MARTIRDEDESRRRRNRGDDDEDVTIPNVKATVDTGPALLCELQDPSREVWVPQSVICDESEVYSAKNGENEGNLVIRGWFARKLKKEGALPDD